ncbi:uncharacterized protein GGS25DRAFT_483189 [Hypoxylon fragiforme]|uniref:uncharacterized protein n=1 Tax=Hypoxylon fragiforme TaxID=63214 RepID=UPI0020C73EB5|nr:uncharacterized protein GGS25DRAFT_483189 [Hypoxylon fragiforme]KAI2611548.1 hypothetical protein GGS25DRAFT_483189 [Hypoxylon fragiforme]
MHILLCKVHTLLLYLVTHHTIVAISAALTSAFSGFISSRPPPNYTRLLEDRCTVASRRHACNTRLLEPIYRSTLNFGYLGSPVP